MDIWTTVRTILEKNPGCRAKKLVAEVRERADLGRSTLYDHLGSWTLRKKCFREKGKYYLPKQWHRHKREIQQPFEILRIPGEWKTLRGRVEKFGLPLLDLKIRKLELGERDPKTGWPKANFDRVLPIQGIVVFNGATDLAAAIPIIIPEKYDACLFTPNLINEVIRIDDQVDWSDKLKLYTIKKVTQIYDGIEPSYIIAMLTELLII